MRQLRQRGGIAGATAVAVGLALSAPLLGLTATPASAGRAPCPAPTPGLTLPVIPDHGVAQAQIFDRQVPDPSVYDGKVDFVWAAGKPEQPPGVVSSYYVTAFRNAPARTFTPDWFRANHPDWIEYTNDRTTPAWEFGNKVYTPLDYTNPEYRAWFLTTIVDPAIAAGYPVIAVDNVVMRNDYFMAGHYDADGAWVQQFGSDPHDAAYVASVLDWLRYLRDYVHSKGVALAVNIGVNASLHDQYHDASPELTEAISQAVDISDIWLNEQGFTVHRVENVTDDEWQIMFDLLRAHPCTLTVMDNKLPTTTWDQADPAQIQWVVANYLLYREQGSMLTTAGSTDYAGFHDIPQLRADLGRPVTPPHRQGPTAWVRSYDDGLTVVNPSSTQTTGIQLEAGTYTDLLGHAYSGWVTVPPNTGLVLTRS